MNTDKRVFLGIDTSCYTTSVAAVDSFGNIVSEHRKVLSVPNGKNGLRQSDGLFQHVKQLPELFGQLVLDCKRFFCSEQFTVAAVAVSAKPRQTDDSYMPVFLAGKAFAQVISDCYSCPLIETDHQYGHLVAAMYKKRIETDRPLFALHLSGGTTEMLEVDLKQKCIRICGQTMDNSAGQMVDRVGVLLGCSFPCGKELESKARTFLELYPSARINEIPIFVKNEKVSFSGPLTALKREYERNENSGLVAAETYSVICRTVFKWILEQHKANGNAQFLLMGGVSSSSLLKEMIQDRMIKQRQCMNILYANPVYSSDNALGVALNGWQKEGKNVSYFD